ncbi:MAG: hypothetical protein HW421_808 [Ignavibacteria bacterium]|nr:hypothetical protein [Ignavibacteria bacterium]
MKLIIYVLVIIAIQLNVCNAVSDSANTNYPKIYFDCDFCDKDYLKSKLMYVNMVRDRFEADIFVKGYSSDLSGGDMLTLDIFGQNRFDGMKDTVSIFRLESHSQDLIREKIAEKINLTLIRYLLKTELADSLKVNYKPVSQNAASQPVDDPWDRWVIKFSLNSNLNGEHSFKYSSLYTYAELKRITEDMKLNFGGYNSFNETFYKLETEDVIADTRSNGAWANIILAIDSNVSYGVWTEISNSSYSNIKYKLYSAAGIEYNFFPYSESIRRQLKFRYRLSPTFAKYMEETIFFKTEELRLAHSIEAVVIISEKWGSIDLSVTYSNYLHDFTKNHINVNMELNLPLFEGLSFFVWGSYSAIHDQLSLVKGSGDVDVYTRRKQLETNFNYSSYIGISYSFGSIYNNIINARF